MVRYTIFYTQSLIIYTYIHIFAYRNTHTHRETHLHRKNICSDCWNVLGFLNPALAGAQHIITASLMNTGSCGSCEVFGGFSNEQSYIHNISWITPKNWTSPLWWYGYILDIYIYTHTYIYIYIYIYIHMDIFLMRFFCILHVLNVFKLLGSAPWLHSAKFRGPPADPLHPLSAMIAGNPTGERFGAGEGTFEQKLMIYEFGYSFFELSTHRFFFFLFSIWIRWSTYWNSGNPK